MDLYSLAFNSPGALATYVNDNTIARVNISAIELRTGKWWLFWWA